MSTNNPIKPVQATVLVRAPKAEISNALQALARQLEQEAGFQSAPIPGTHFSAGSSLLEGDHQSFAIITIVEEGETHQDWE